MERFTITGATQIDADKLRQALHDRVLAALDEIDEALARVAAAADRMVGLPATSHAYHVQHEAWRGALCDERMAYAKAEAFKSVLDLVGEMTQPCDECGSSPDNCGCVSN